MLKVHIFAPKPEPTTVTLAVPVGAVLLHTADAPYGCSKEATLDKLNTRILLERANAVRERPVPALNLQMTFVVAIHCVLEPRVPPTRPPTLLLIGPVFCDTTVTETEPVTAKLLDCTEVTWT